jgi:hypothetical protein
MSLLTQNLDANKKSGVLRKDLEDLGNAMPQEQDNSQPAVQPLMPVQTGVPAGVTQGLPQYKKGTKSVPRTGPAIVHKGEAIVPAKDNPFKDNSNLHDPRHPSHEVFKNARSSAKHEYLKAVDSDYARATPDQQAGYRKHLQGDTTEPGFGKIAMPQQKGFGSAMPSRSLQPLTERVLSSLGLAENAKDKIRSSGLDDQSIQQMVSRFSKQQLEALAK